MQLKLLIHILNCLPCLDPIWDILFFPCGTVRGSQLKSEFLSFCVQNLVLNRFLLSLMYLSIHHTMQYLLSLKLRGFQIVLCKSLFIYTKSCHILREYLVQLLHLKLKEMLAGKVKCTCVGIYKNKHFCLWHLSIKHFSIL